MNWNKNISLVNNYETIYNENLFLTHEVWQFKKYAQIFMHNVNPLATEFFRRFSRDSLRQALFVYRLIRIFSMIPSYFLIDDPFFGPTGLYCKSGPYRVSPLLPSIPYMARLVKIDFNFRRYHQKMFYDRCDYESVDEKSLS